MLQSDDSLRLSKMGSKTWLTVLVAASCCACSWGFGTGFQYTVCDLQAQNSGDATMQCHPGNSATDCPSGKTYHSHACNSNEVCCNGVETCTGIDCNNGTCVNNLCECFDGYNGTFCTIDMCEPGNNDCSANSECNRIAAPELYNCTCFNGYSGPLCDTDACLDNGPCVNGTCVREAAPLLQSCTCDDGFSGLICNEDACDPTPCENSGSCVRQAGGTYTCNCEGYWFGDNCTETMCDANPCENGGTCVPLTNTTYQCNCGLSYQGDNCTTLVCDVLDCNNGTCVTNMCECFDGYNGTFCTIDMCESGNNDCSANSECNRIAAPELYNCTCFNGYSGPLCDTDACLDNGPCVNGTCVREAAPLLQSCTCDDGFSGLICNEDACDPTPCENSGSCVRQAGGTYNCTCVGYWFGDNCTETICNANPCGSNGTCAPLTTTTYQCTCDLNYKDENCSTLVCIGDNSECNGNGTCIPDMTGNYSCNCFEGFSGPDCSTAEPLCGLEQGHVAPRLINTADDFQYASPWLINVVLDGIIVCSGVLMSNTRVVTDAFCAAHCNDGCNVTVGDWDITDNSEPYQESIAVSNIVFHDLAVENTTQGFYALGDLETYLANNVAILELATPITKGQGVNTACPPQGFSAISCESDCKLASFGGNNENIAVTRPNKRQVVDVKTIDDDVCRYSRGLLAMPAQTHCVFMKTDNAGACFADFGGGIVCRDPATNRYTLEGIIAFQPSATSLCSKQIAVYSDIGSLWSWIAPRLV